MALSICREFRGKKQEASGREIVSVSRQADRPKRIKPIIDFLCHLIWLSALCNDVQPADMKIINIATPPRTSIPILSKLAPSAGPENCNKSGISILNRHLQELTNCIYDRTPVVVEKRFLPLIPHTRRLQEIPFSRGHSSSTAKGNIKAGTLYRPRRRVQAIKLTGPPLPAAPLRMCLTRFSSVLSVFRALWLPSLQNSATGSLSNPILPRQEFLSEADQPPHWRQPPG